MADRCILFDFFGTLNTHSQDLVENHLAAMGVRDCFDVVVTSLAERCRKPRPEIFRTALQRMDVASDTTIFVGDSVVADYRGAEAAGMIPLLVDPDARSGEPHVANRTASLFELQRWMDTRGL